MKTNIFYSSQNANVIVYVNKHQESWWEQNTLQLRSGLKQTLQTSKHLEHLCSNLAFENQNQYKKSSNLWK